MIKVESVTLEQAYKDAAKELECSVTQLSVEVVQVPSSGIFGLFKKSAIIVAARKPHEHSEKTKDDSFTKVELHQTKVVEKKEESLEKSGNYESKKSYAKEQEPKTLNQNLNDVILPSSFVSIQDEDESGFEDINDTILEIELKINALFDRSCFNIDRIMVSKYDEKTLLFEFNGEDAALLIGKEGYRYKALSYMIFNWVSSNYDFGVRLEIAEFLKNQEQSVSKYLQSVYESVDRDGRAQTKTLDGVLIQIALKELRDRYPYKYVAIRTTKDGLKYIIINENYSL